ncbi:MAG: hypothetical protein E7172_05775 [Firmicutes bacterium]|nr:hypothetical protein [Bacillota bacterium]
MKNIYIRDNNSIFKISLKYFYALVPLILFGFYKNGIMLYQKGLINFIGIFKPLLFIITGIIIGATVNFIYEKIINKNNNNLKDILFSSFHILYGLITSCLVSINTNFFIFLVITFLVLFFSKILKIKSINLMSLTSLLIILITYLISDFSYLNIYESNTILNLNATDYLIGRGSGGIATTFIGGLIFSIIILWNERTYKKEVALYGIITFVGLIFLYVIYKSNVSSIFELLFTNGILFSLIFVATDSVSSSYTKTGKIFYGIFTGLLTFILYLINPAFSCLGAILISSILSYIFDAKFE